MWCCAVWSNQYLVLLMMLERCTHEIEINTMAISEVLFLLAVELHTNSSERVNVVVSAADIYILTVFRLTATHRFFHH